METYMISSAIYLDQLHKCYKKIITIKPEPPTSDPLKPYIKRIHIPKVSPFKQNTCCTTTEKCSYVVMNPSNTHEFLQLEDINELFSLLLSNSYTINSELTNLLKPVASGSSNSSNKNSLPELICVVTKNKN